MANSKVSVCRSNVLIMFLLKIAKRSIEIYRSGPLKVPSTGCPVCVARQCSARLACRLDNAE